MGTLRADAPLGQWRLQPNAARTRTGRRRPQSTKLLAVKTMRLLGSRDLKRYRGWKGTAELIAKEHEKNQKAGLEQGTWHNGVVDTTLPRAWKAPASNGGVGAGSDSEDVRAAHVGGSRCVAVTDELTASPCWGGCPAHGCAGAQEFQAPRKSG